MISKLDELLEFHRTALALRSYRQQVLASNIANADVPRFRARDFDFSRALQNAQSRSAEAVPLKTTSPRHLLQATGERVVPELLYRVPHQDSIDGNTVDMDVERVQFAENAIHIEANLAFLNSQIKSMLAAIQG